MKIAKKVLAVAMAVAMIACFAAMAFAANDKVSLKASEVEDNMFILSIVTKDGDLKTADWDIYYDATALKVVEDDGDALIYFGDDLAKATKLNKIMGQFNAKEAGVILCAATTTEGLAADVGSKFNAETGVEFLCIEFEVIKADAANVKVVLTEKDNKEAVIAETVLFPKAEETTTAAPETTTAAPETTTAEAPSTPVETTTAAANDGAGNLGDTGALAIAAGVVALAGAAFVVTKKRK